MEDLRENVEIRIWFSKKHCIPPRFHKGCLHFESKYVINEHTGLSGNDHGG